MQVSQVPADRISGEIGAEGRVEQGNVSGSKQEVLFADLNTVFRVVAEQLSALLESGGGKKVLAVGCRGRI